MPFSVERPGKSTTELHPRNDLFLPSKRENEQAVHGKANPEVNQQAPVESGGPMLRTEGQEGVQDGEVEEVPSQHGHQGFPVLAQHGGFGSLAEGFYFQYAGKFRLVSRRISSTARRSSADRRANFGSVSFPVSTS